MPPGRRGFSTQLSDDLQHRVRATVRGVAAATGTDFTLAQLVEDALTRHCAWLEDAYHDGIPWDHEPRGLRPGRRITETRDIANGH